MWQKIQTSYISYLLKKGDKQIAIKKQKKIYFKALKFAKKHKLSDDYAAIYFNIAVSNHINEYYQKAIISLNLAQKHPTDDMSYTLIVPLKLNILFNNEKLKEARALAITTLRKDKVYELYATLSEIYLALDVQHKAIINAKKSLDLAWKEEYMTGIELSYNNLLDIYRQTNNIEALKYYIDEIEHIGLFENSAILQVTHYNILVTQQKYEEAKTLLPSIESKVIQLEYEHLHIFYAMTLELFKKLRDKEKFEHYFKKFLTTHQEKKNYYEKWLAYSQAGDFYRDIKEHKKAISYYKEMAFFLEKVRLTSLNQNSLDRVNFFKDKYHYLLEASLFLYEQKENDLAFYFLESSKSASLRDIDPYKTLAIKNSTDIKGYL